MLRRWEDGDEEIRSLWSMMNSWVYAGFDETYKRMGVSFDEIYYESETYLLGKEEVLRGLKEGKFVQDLTARYGLTSQTKVLTARSSSALMAPQYTSHRISVRRRCASTSTPLIRWSMS